MKRLFAILMAMMLWSEGFCGFFVVAQEEGSVSYSRNGEVKKTEGVNKVYYEVDLEKGIVTRTKVVALQTNQFRKKGEVVSDNAVYKIIVNPLETVALGERVIHALRQPRAGYELLTIGKDCVMLSKATGESVIVLNMPILERSDVTD